MGPRSGEDGRMRRPVRHEDRLAHEPSYADLPLAGAGGASPGSTIPSGMGKPFQHGRIREADHLRTDLEDALRTLETHFEHRLGRSQNLQRRASHQSIYGNKYLDVAFQALTAITLRLITVLEY